MLDIKHIRDNAEDIKQNCINRRVDVNIERLVELDEVRRKWLTNIESFRAEINKNSKSKPTPEEIQRLKTISSKLKNQEQRYKDSTEEYNNLMLAIPNLTHPETPTGGEEDFATLESHGDKPNFDFDAKDHEVLLTEKGLIDFEAGAKVAGSKFYFSKNDLVRLNFALLQYGIDVASKYGFELIETPDMAKNDILEGAGFNPRGEETQIYRIEGTDMSLIGTAEITTLGYHAGETLDLSEGPKKYLALSHCYRTEAGSYGRTSKGLYRVHQFTKLEMFVFCKPEDSEAHHQEILNIEKEIADGLEIPYRVIDIASGDLGGPAYRKYDIEAYMVMAEDYAEITSTSNCTDYQARRLNIKYKTEDGKSDFVHTLNGTAVVLSRFPIALVENHQQADGSVKIPKVLQGYMGGREVM